MTDKKIVPIHYTELIKVFEHDGFIVRRMKGDHVVMTAVDLVTLSSKINLRDAGLYDNRKLNITYQHQ